MPLCRFVLKHILGQMQLHDAATLRLKDVADIDPQLCQSLSWMQDNPVEELGACVCCVRVRALLRTRARAHACVRACIRSLF